MKAGTNEHGVALALGANLGDRATTIQEALRQLEQRGVRPSAVSTLIETVPYGCAPGTPDFLNGALVGGWTGTPEALLVLCQSVERELGRPADHGVNQSRIIDIDILLFDDLILKKPHLIIPHPRLIHRPFVLTPMAEIAPDWIVPGTGLTIRQWATLVDES